jgi:hypothetical protein
MTPRKTIAWPCLVPGFPRWLLAAAALMAALHTHAEQLPETPPADWHVTLRLYGTTDMLGRDALRVLAHQGGSVPARMTVVRPRYLDNAITMELDSPQEKKILRPDEAQAIYRAARAVVLNMQLGAGSRGLADGTSLEVAIGSGDRRIAAIFDHSSYLASGEVRKLMDVINPGLPKAFQLQ